MMDSTHVATRPVADFQVRDDVDEVWRLYYGQWLADLDRCRKHIHSMYCRGLELLNLPRERMPCIAQLNAVLRDIGWSAVRVEGVISETHLAELLQARRFPVAGNVRSLIDLHHSPEPDALHDIIGHLPLLFSTDYTCFLQTWSYRVLAASEGRMVELVRELQTRVEQVEKCEASDVLRSGLRRHLERLRGGVSLQARNVITLLSRLYLWNSAC